MTTHYESESDRYWRQLETVATAWRIAHPVQWGEINSTVMLNYTTAEPGGFRRRVILVTQIAAGHAGFPSFASWMEAQGCHWSRPQTHEAA